MVKQGGRSYSGKKKGMTGTSCTCKPCGRGYKQKWTLENHEKLCKEFNKGKKE